jgi:hypothetical protein
MERIMALWAKKEGDTSDVEPLDASKAGDLEQLSATLDQFGQMLQAANRQVTEYLLRRESDSAAQQPAAPTPDADLLRPIGEKLDQLAEKIDQLEPAGQGKTSDAEPSSTPAPADNSEVLAAVGQLHQQVTEQRQALDGALGHIWQRIDTGLRELTERLASPEEDQTDHAPSTAELQQAILGPQLTGRGELAEQREQLIADLLAGNDGARALAGQLLVFRATPPERMAQMLRDIGDAYYRWQPKTSPGTQPLEGALAQWVTAQCDEAGIGNRIELVDPGERFDAARHNATGRGVEITQVLGWLVLRDNGRVYTKANVAVR